MSLPLWLADIIEVATLISVIIAVIAVVQASRQFQRGINVQIFLEYTRRYESVLGSLPAGAREARLALSANPPPVSEELTTAILKYLNLCSEEFYLVKEGYLVRELWDIWAEELERMVSSPLLQREWQLLRGEFEAYPEFQSYIDEIQEGGRRDGRGGLGSS